MIKWIISGLIMFGLMCYVAIKGEDKSSVWEDKLQQEYLDYLKEKHRIRQGDK